MITVHHLNNSRSQRILWLLEELSVPYEIKRYERDPKTMLAPPSLREVHPLGKSPVVTDGDRTLAESGAILEYLLDHYAEGRLRPPSGSRERDAFTYFLHYAEGSFMPLLFVGLLFVRLPKAPMPFFVKPVVRSISNKVRNAYVLPNVQKHLAYIEAELTKHEWFAGDAFTAADIQMSFPLEACAARIGLGDAHPRIARFLERIHARDAYKRAVERGGAFSLLG